MKKVSIPAPVSKAAQSFVSKFGEGVYFLGKSGDFDVFTYSPKNEPEIGAIRFLYKKGEDVLILHGMDALDLELSSEV